MSTTLTFIGICKSGDLRLVMARVAPAGRLAPDGYQIAPGYFGKTHYGFIKRLNNESIKSLLLEGSKLFVPRVRLDPDGGTTLGGMREVAEPYRISNTQGGYLDMSKTPKNTDECK